uniref:Protein kinase domain-containing protein n=1 Tax=Oryza barthii TaxID=65489 RepID=A0A0D3FUP9_9ORYZ
MATCLAAVAASCQRKCGQIDIPYPFGIGGQPGCAMTGFELSCNDTGNGVPTLLLRNMEVLDISLPLGQAQMKMDMSYDCHNTTRNDIDCVDMVDLNLKGSPFTFSDTANKFIVFGCRMLAYLGPGEQNDVGSNLTIGCAATCGIGDDLVSINSAGCSGIGCCQTNIPKGIQYYKVWFDGRFNTTDIYNWTRCAYAALVETSSFNFSTVYNSLSRFNDNLGSQPPFVVDWAIGNSTYEQAKINPDSYMCISSNSVCLNSRNGPGYICNCQNGFEGNPYLNDSFGCQGKTKGVYMRCKLILMNARILESTFAMGNVSINRAVSLSVVLLIRKQRSDIQKQQRKKYFRKNQGLLLQQLISSDERASDNTKIFSLEELKQATNNFDPTRVLGSGGHGMVYKGILSDQHVVAIKKPNIIREEEISQFINEVAILSQINHRHIVKLFGCCLETEVPLLVYDFVPNGSLNQIIHGATSNRESSLSWDDCLRIATEAAGALYYLHSAASVSVLHRDVKSSNILLDANYTAKVADFGASRLIPNDQTHVFTNIQGTFEYLDPEYYHTGHLNEKSDVYSFGVVLLELLLRRQPIFECESGTKKNLSIYFLYEIKGRPITEIVAPEVLEEATEDEINTVTSIAQACLRLRGEERPTMKQVEMSLQSVRNKCFSSASTSPESNHGMQPPLSETYVNQHQSLGVHTIGIINLASSNCNSLQQEFMLSASFAR